MLIDKKYHLTYCTNIHPGESWEEVFQNLASYTIAVRNKVSPGHPFGIGLRLSAIAASQLLQEKNLEQFRTWLTRNNLYVFTINGFPYGEFHNQAVKDKVHQPDWRTPDRLDYTFNLIRILEELLPEHLEEGSISTSPVSYRHWIKTAEERKLTFTTACHYFGRIVQYLHNLKMKKGRLIHIGIEPEPDGLIENTSELICFFREYLVPVTGTYLQCELRISPEKAEEIIKTHIRICYDICHSSVMYEDPEETLATLKEEGIRIGKIQVSAAIKLSIEKHKEFPDQSIEKLVPFAGSTYLHQVVGKGTNGMLIRYPDLGPALKELLLTAAQEWRMHFHVPVFTSLYNGISSTQDDVRKVLALLEKETISTHLEIETYTWEILPADMRTELVSSIAREYQWVLQNLNLDRYEKNSRIECSRLN